MRGLAQKRIVVASGATGIGAATAERLAAEGACVLVGDINADGAAATVERIRKAGGTAEPAWFDLGDPSSIAALIESCVSRFGGIDGLATVGAEIALAQWELGRDLSDMEPEKWERTFAVNVTGHALAMKAAIPHMVRCGGGAIVAVTSAAAVAGFPTQPAYGASKVALHALIRHVAARWGKQNIRCNGVAPGWALSETLKSKIDRKVLDDAVAALPSTRLGTPEDMAAAMAFMLSEDAGWINGQILAVNGGAFFRD
jgi:NAD(P)-dependent dehydrogenase (short-subunit alcohol dehydrogenase family)